MKRSTLLLVVTMLSLATFLPALQSGVGGGGQSNVGGGGGGTPGGANTQVQFNNNGAFGGSANLTFTPNTLVIGQNTTAGTLQIFSTGSGAMALSSPSNQVLLIGNGSPGSAQIAALLDLGTTFGASGCANTTATGGSTAGSYVSVTAGACTVTITMGSSVVAAHGWVCDAHDITTAADANNVTQGSLVSTTQATLVEGTVVANDVIIFKCIGY